MQELKRALSDVHEIRHQMARSTQFRGYGPLSIASSGLLAVLVAWAQVSWEARSPLNLSATLTIWILTASVSLFVSALETYLRAQRVHCGLAQEMLQSAVEHMLPALTAGVLLTAVLVRLAPMESWLLPGLWGVIFSLGVFASCRFLPRPMFLVGIWYLAAGLGSVAAGCSAKIFLPWAMGISFGVGQLLVAGVLWICVKGDYEEEA